MQWKNPLLVPARFSLEFGGAVFSARRRSVWQRLRFGVSIPGDAFYPPNGTPTKSLGGTTREHATRAWASDIRHGYEYALAVGLRSGMHDPCGRAPICNSERHSTA
jgi:hypothetical protein